MFSMGVLAMTDGSLDGPCLGHRGERGWEGRWPGLGAGWSAAASSAGRSRTWDELLMVCRCLVRRGEEGLLISPSRWDRVVVADVWSEGRPRRNRCPCG